MDEKWKWRYNYVVALAIQVLMFLPISLPVTLRQRCYTCRHISHIVGGAGRALVLGPCCWSILVVYMNHLSLSLREGGGGLWMDYRWRLVRKFIYCLGSDKFRAVRTWAISFTYFFIITSVSIFCFFSFSCFIRDISSASVEDNSCALFQHFLRLYRMEIASFVLFIFRKMLVLPTYG